MLGPLVATVLAMSAAIPTGASEMTNWVIFIITAAPPSMKDNIPAASSSSTSNKKIPKRREKKMTPNISKVAAASTIFSGIMEAITSQKDCGGCASRACVGI